MTLPFELPKYHKSVKKRKWKFLGVDMDNFDEIYNRYINSSQCELCNKIYEKTYDRCLDHCHTTGKFRNVVCRRCNTLKSDTVKRKENTSGYKNITVCKAPLYKTGLCYWVEFSRNGKKICQKRNKTLEDAILFRDNFIKENPSLFT